MKRSDRRKDAQLERQLAKVLGFTKPWKSTPVTLDGVAKNANGDKKPGGTRLLKAECGECGYTVRVTKKWLEAKGAPICPCNMKAMVADMPEAPEARSTRIHFKDDAAVGGRDNGPGFRFQPPAQVFQIAGLNCGGNSYGL